MIINTTAKQVHEELKKDMPEIYPQRYQGYKVNSVNYNVIISDIETYWNTEARFREGFSGDDETKTVTVPNFFTKVNGIYKDKEKYIKFVKMLRESSNTITINENYYIPSDIVELRDEFMENRSKDYDRNQFKTDYLNYTVHDYSVEPTIQNVLTGNIYCFRIKNTKDFTFEYLTSDKKQLVLDVMTRILMDSNNVMKLKTASDYMEFVSFVMTLDQKYINMLNNFDYGLEVPKLVVSKAELNKTTAMLLYFMNEMGVDIVILSPSGKSNVEKYYDINNLSLGYFDLEFNLDTQIVLDSDKARIKEEKKEESKRKVNDFIEELCFPYCVWPILMLGFTILGEILGWRGWVNTLIQAIFLFILIIMECLFCDGGDDIPVIIGMYGIAIAIFVVVLCGRGIYYLYQSETNPQKSTNYYSGFQNIEEEAVTEDGFTIRQRDEAVIKGEGYTTMYYYLENNSNNQFDIVFEVWVGNNIIYRSDTMNPLTYIKVIHLESELPEGDTILTAKYYKDEGYNPRSLDNVCIGEKEFIVHVLTDTEREELEKEVKENNNQPVELYGYEIN